MILFVILYLLAGIYISIVLAEVYTQKALMNGKRVKNWEHFSWQTKMPSSKYKYSRKDYIANNPEPPKTLPVTSWTDYRKFAVLTTPVLWPLYLIGPLLLKLTVQPIMTSAKYLGRELVNPKNNVKELS